MIVVVWQAHTVEGRRVQVSVIPASSDSGMAASDKEALQPPELHTNTQTQPHNVM